MTIIEVNALGYGAPACTTLSFIPQILKIRKEGGTGVSYLMLSVYLLGLMLWLIYGIALHAAAVVVANAASGALVAGTILTKAWTQSEFRRSVGVE